MPSAATVGRCAGETGPRTGDTPRISAAPGTVLTGAAPCWPTRSSPAPGDRAEGPAGDPARRRLTRGCYPSVLICRSRVRKPGGMREVLPFRLTPWVDMATLRLATVALRVAAVAGAQWGVISAAQLRDCGVTRTRGRIGYRRPSVSQRARVLRTPSGIAPFRSTGARSVTVSDWGRAWGWDCGSACDWHWDWASTGAGPGGSPHPDRFSFPWRFA
jgi:hypothetical protein